MSFESVAQDHWDELLMLQIETENLESINTVDHEMSCFQIGDTLVFVKFKQRSRKDKPTRGEKEFDLYKAILIDNQFSQTSSFDDKINSKYVEGPGTFHALSKTMYFTRTHEIDDENQKGKTLKLRIYKSGLVNNEWQEPQQLDFLLGDFNFLHPAISEDGRTMIFASDMPGGFGKMDLYYSQYEYGEWGKPINMGANVNSEFNEVFPTIYRDLFFYSNDSEAQFDIYKNDLENFKTKQSLKMLPPFNSDRDDFSLVVNTTGDQAFMSSNRAGGQGADDLYRLNMPMAVFNTNPNAAITNIVVIDKLRLTPVNNASVSITKINLTEKDLLDVITSDLVLSDNDELILKLKPTDQLSEFVPVGAEGSVFKEVDVTSSYIVKTKADGYELATMIVRPKKDLTDFTVLMNPKAEPIVSVPIAEPINKEVIQDNIIIPLETGKTVVFENIYYESNSAAIKPGAAAELDVLARVMKENNDLRVQLSAHTDAIGSSIYNQALSEKRAASAKKYLVNKGVSTTRITTIGYGESRLRNQCGDGVKCSKEEHKYNRRTEVTVL